MKLRCTLHGRMFHLQTHSEGIKAGEYVFFTGYSAAFRKDCDKCDDTDCPYGFNISKFRKNKRLRKRVLDYVFNPIIDELADKHRISVSLDINFISFLEPVKSSVCVGKRDGEKLLKLQDKMYKKRKEMAKLYDKLFEEFHSSEHLPQRTLGKKKKRLNNEKDSNL